MASAESSLDPNGPAFDVHGWWRDARHLPSPNFDARPTDEAVDLIVLHNISLPPGLFGGGSIAKLFQNQLDCTSHVFFSLLDGVRVSAHFLIDRQGCAFQFVAVADRAWHAGASEFCGRPRCNDFSIGIELEGTDFVAFAEAQYHTLAKLTRELRRHYPIAAVCGHSDIARGRKSDPGPFFDWARYAQAAQLSSACLPLHAR